MLFFWQLEYYRVSILYERYSGGGSRASMPKDITKVCESTYFRHASEPMFRQDPEKIPQGRPGMQKEDSGENDSAFLHPRKFGCASLVGHSASKCFRWLRLKIEGLITDILRDGISCVIIKWSGYAIWGLRCGYTESLVGAYTNV